MLFAVECILETLQCAQLAIRSGAICSRMHLDVFLKYCIYEYALLLSADVRVLCKGPLAPSTLGPG